MENTNIKEILKAAQEARNIRTTLNRKLDYLTSFCAYEFLSLKGHEIEVKAYVNDEGTAAEIVHGVVDESKNGYLIIELTQSVRKAIPLERIVYIELY